MELLGARVGKDLNAISTALESQVSSQHSTFFRVLNELPAQLSLLLLRVAGIPRLNYLARTQYPQVLHAAAEAFDENVLICPLSSHRPAVMLLPLTVQATAQTMLPMSEGGLGLSAYAITSHAAFVAAATQAAPYVTPFASSQLALRANHRLLHPLHAPQRL